MQYKAVVWLTTIMIGSLTAERRIFVSATLQNRPIKRRPRAAPMATKQPPRIPCAYRPQGNSLHPPKPSNSRTTFKIEAFNFRPLIEKRRQPFASAETTRCRSSALEAKKGLRFKERRPHAWLRTPISPAPSPKPHAFGSKAPKTGSKEGKILETEALFGHEPPPRAPPEAWKSRTGAPSGLESAPPRDLATKTRPLNSSNAIVAIPQ